MKITLNEFDAGFVVTPPTGDLSLVQHRPQRFDQIADAMLYAATLARAMGWTCDIRASAIPPHWRNLMLTVAVAGIDQFSPAECLSLCAMFEHDRAIGAA